MDVTPSPGTHSGLERLGWPVAATGCLSALERTSPLRYLAARRLLIWEGVCEVRLGPYR
ncbi:MAG: hypothetical protein WCK35_22750 [Chloroflexota bacterium]